MSRGMGHRLRIHNGRGSHLSCEMNDPPGIEHLEHYLLPLPQFFSRARATSAPDMAPTWPRLIGDGNSDRIGGPPGPESPENRYSPLNDICRPGVPVRTILSKSLGPRRQTRGIQRRQFLVARTQIASARQSKILRSTHRPLRCQFPRDSCGLFCLQVD